jgi:hypothetical protein
MVQPEKDEHAQESAAIFVSEYIAPWALPKEEIPVHLVWTPENRFDQIQVLTSSNMAIKEFYNVQDFVTTNSETIIKKLYSPNFFGFTIISNRITNKIHERKEITVNFLAKGKTVQSRSFVANIYRPELSIIEKPTSLILRDNSDLKGLLNISVKISGFGNMEIATEVSFGGKFEPNIEPLFQELARRIASMARKGIPTSTDKASSKEKRIRVNPLYIRKLTRILIDQIKNGELTMLDLSDVEDFSKWMEKKENKERIRRVLAEHLENIIIESILYYFNKYPTESVALYGGNPSVIIKNAVQELVIRFKYRDAMLNEYEPMLVEIPVQDIREDKNKELKIPINMKWVHKQVNPTVNGVRC